MSYDIHSISETSFLKFRTGAAMLSRLGSEQLKDDITAFIELVKNAYDADATEVVIRFENKNSNQEIMIQDNGTGMTYDDLQNKWAFLATENKLYEKRSLIFKRRRLGQKGVGRFAAEKLGSTLVLRTRTKNEDKVKQVKFNWDQMSGENELSEYKFDILKKKPKKFEPNEGTTLIIQNLRINWSKRKVEKLRRQLCLLIDPETSVTDFRIHLFTEWNDLNGELHNPLSGNETHRIKFEIKADGSESTEIAAGSNIKKDKKKLNPTTFGPISGRLRYFGKGLPRSERARGNDPDADWNVGIRIFRDGCRVRPFGEPGPDGDWLQIYRTRYDRGSKFRLKPHYLEGTIHITFDDNPELQDTTSREGLPSNEAYDELVNYVKDKIAQLSEIVREEEMKEERRKTKERHKKALEPLSSGLSALRSDQYRKAVSESDLEIRKQIIKIFETSEVRNTHWECLDCNDS